MALMLFGIYALAIIAICALVYFGEFRRRQLQRLAEGVSQTGSRVDHCLGAVANWGQTGSSTLATAIGDASSVFARHRWWLLAAGLIVTLPVAAIWLLRGQVSLDGYADTRPHENTVVGVLLAGEQLVPPPPLPPEVFTTREVLAERPALGSASRDWKLLDRSFEQTLLRLFQRMREQGYEMALLEGYRSPERQNQLASMGDHVTNARAFQSYHQYGLAADCAFLRDGKLVISERDPWAMRGYELYGQEAAALGLTWGGGWKLKDFGHVELHRAKTPLAAQTNRQ